MALSLTFPRLHIVSLKDAFLSCFSFSYIPSWQLLSISGNPSLLCLPVTNCTYSTRPISTYTKTSLGDNLFSRASRPTIMAAPFSKSEDVEPELEEFQPYINATAQDDFGQPEMEDYNQHHSHFLQSGLSDPDFYLNSPVADFRPPVKVEEYTGISFTQKPLDYVHPPTTHIQPAETELESSWPLLANYPWFHVSNLLAPTSNMGGLHFPYHPAPPISPPHSNYRFFDDTALRTPWSSPEYMPREPISTNGDDELTDVKPYARLIWEALMEAPGKRMMLRDIYEWFRKNTTKAQGNATNGWQNSIRHNLSMNKVRDLTCETVCSANNLPGF